MNILLFCSNPVNGGTARVFFELSNFFDENKKDDDVVFSAVNIHNSVEIYRKVPNVDRIDVLSKEELFDSVSNKNIVGRMFKKVYSDVVYSPTKERNITTMCEYILSNKIEAVFIHNGGYVGDDLCNQMLEAAWRCSNQVRCRAYIFHNDFEKNLLKKLRFYPYDKFVEKRATELITVSEYTSNRIRKESFIKKEISVIYNGLSKENTLSESEKQAIIELEPSKRHVLMIGNFQENKGQLYFIEAISNIVKHKKNVDFTLIGNVYDNEYYNECMNKIKINGIERYIQIYQGINNAAEYMNLFDVVVVPSIYDESFGLISVEAMSHGVPVVAFACGGIPEVQVNGETGYIVRVGDSAALGEKILQLLSDANICEEMSQNGVNRYEKMFSVNAMGKMYFDVLKKYR